jgi:hypothetical protein
MWMKQGSPLKIIVTALVIICLFVVGLCGCSAQQPSPPSSTTSPAITEVRVVVTQNFGQELMFDRVVKIEDGACAMDALKQVAEIETAYGGGFVNAINGVRSQYTGDRSARVDWFIYANGILTNVGALDYTLHPGDIECWDIHDWSFRHFIPAIIGHFPEPFVHGYEGEVRPTIVVYQGNWKKEAEDVANKLNQLGVEDASAKSISELSGEERKSCNLLLLGDKDSELISELNQVWSRLGFFAHFEEGKLVVLNPKGEVTAKYGAESGLIQATQNLWNPKGIGVCENVVWMVSGTDETGVKNAVDTLINHYSEFQYAYAVVIANGKVIKVPRLNH